MKNFAYLVMFLLCASVVFADEIDKRVFVVGDCSLEFRQSAFGPGENGKALLICGNQGIIYPYQYDPPVLQVDQWKFVLVDGKLYYLDPIFLVLSE